eukprot:5247015-Amphidinium_carterae.2
MTKAIANIASGKDQDGNDVGPYHIVIQSLQVSIPTNPRSDVLPHCVSLKPPLGLEPSFPFLGPLSGSSSGVAMPD